MITVICRGKGPELYGSECGIFHVYVYEHARNISTNEGDTKCATSLSMDESVILNA